MGAAIHGLPALALALAAVSLAGCAENGQPDPHHIVAQAIEAHGGESFERARITFRLRDARFEVQRDQGLYRYVRRRPTEEGMLRDVMTNDSLYRELDGVRQPLDEAGRRGLETAVNSVVYFVLLPYPLQDPAVRLRYLDSAIVAGEPYHKVEVTFDPEQGGLDWEDRFVHWIHARDHSLDYLAYRYQRDGGGTRFRIVRDRQTVGGIVFQDYENVRHEGIERIEDYDRLWEEGRTEHVSDIVLEDVRVEQLSPLRSEPEARE